VQVIAAIQRWREQPAFARTLPFALYIAFLALAPMAHGWQEFDPRWLYGIQISAVILALALYWHSYGEIRAGIDLAWREWLLAVLAGCAVFVLWINLDQGWAVIGESKGFIPQQADGALDWPLVVMRVFGAALVVPVMEELFWRSLVMRWIERPAFLGVAPRDIGWRAVLMSSVVFGAEHSLWLAGILAGVAYAWLYRRSGKLWAPIVAHAVTNLLLGIWVVATGNWQFW
jgi:CAAX prenyl protease-like protein